MMDMAKEGDPFKPLQIYSNDIYEIMSAIQKQALTFDPYR